MSDWAQLMEDGKRHYLAGEFPQACHSLRQAAEASPESVETWRALGFALVSAGNASDATNAFNTALRLDSKEAESHFGLGLIRFETGDLELAIKEFDGVLALRPGHARAKSELVKSLLKLGMMKSHAGDKAGGGALYKRAFIVQPGSVETATSFVEFLFEQGRFLDAFETAQAAKQAAPGDPRIVELYTQTATDPRVVRARRDSGLS